MRIYEEDSFYYLDYMPSLMGELALKNRIGEGKLHTSYGNGATYLVPQRRRNGQAVIGSQMK